MNSANLTSPTFSGLVVPDFPKDFPFPPLVPHVLHVPQVARFGHRFTAGEDGDDRIAKRIAIHSCTSYNLL